MFAYVIIERDGENPWVLTFGNREKATEFASEIRELTEEPFRGGFHNFAYVLSEYDTPTPEAARRRIETEVFVVKEDA